WRDEMKHHPMPKEGSYKQFEEWEITKANPEKWGTNLQGIFINIDWDKIPFSSFVTIYLFRKKCPCRIKC
ncbi:MAG: hypothetical protein ACKO96_30385, partial [Flammeovirgaceae bacterium]